MMKTYSNQRVKELKTEFIGITRGKKITSPLYARPDFFTDPSIFCENSSYNIVPPQIKAIYTVYQLLGV